MEADRPRLPSQPEDGTLDEPRGMDRLLGVFRVRPVAGELAGPGRRARCPTPRFRGARTHRKRPDLRQKSIAGGDGLVYPRRPDRISTAKTGTCLSPRVMTETPDPHQEKGRNDPVAIVSFACETDRSENSHPGPPGVQSRDREPRYRDAVGSRPPRKEDDERHQDQARTRILHLGE
jgi:hypothetical protein